MNSPAKTKGKVELFLVPPPPVEISCPMQQVAMEGLVEGDRSTDAIVAPAPQGYGMGGEGSIHSQLAVRADKAELG